MVKPQTYLISLNLSCLKFWWGCFSVFLGLAMPVHFASSVCKVKTSLGLFPNLKCHYFVKKRPINV